MSDNLKVMLLAMLGSEELCQKWWNGLNLAFDSQCPNEVYTTDPEKVYTYVLSFLQR